MHCELRDHTGHQKTDKTPRRKHVLMHFELRDHTGHQKGIKLQFLAIQVNVITTRPPWTMIRCHSTNLFPPSLHIWMNLFLKIDVMCGDRKISKEL